MNIRSIVITAILGCFLMGSPAMADNSTTQKLGLYVSNDGTLMRNGKAYRGVGVNYFNAFLRTLQNPSDNSYVNGFSYLASQNIPVVRFAACGFWPNDFKLYQTNKAQYFALLDKVVKTAEDYGVGLIPSLFWFDAAVPDMMGESLNQWGNPNSKTIAFMRTYTAEVVSRYLNSPAIWGWEFGNEFNAYADLLDQASNWLPPVNTALGTPASRSINDAMTTNIISVALTEFAKVVRQYDANRIISSGNGQPQWNAYHRHNAAWSKDTAMQHAYILGNLSPGGINTYSVHVYPWNSTSSSPYFADMSAVLLGDVVKVEMQAASLNNEPLIMGEFGSSVSTTVPGQEQSDFTALINSIESNKVPLALLWVFDFSPQEGIWNVTPYNSRAYQLTAIVQLNQRIKAQLGL